MDYKSLSAEIKKMVEVVEGVPEDLRPVCFGALLDRYLRQELEDLKEPQDRGRKPEGGAPGSARAPSVPLNAQLRVFMKKHEISQGELDALVYYDTEAARAHILREPKAERIARGQIDWALLLALVGAIERQQFSVDPEDVRSICIEKGYYDRANFATNFKGQKNARFFRGPMKPQGEAQQLSDAGQGELAALIRSLVSGS